MCYNLIVIHKNIYHNSTCSVDVQHAEYERTRRTVIIFFFFLQALFCEKLQEAGEGDPASRTPVVVAVHDCDPGAEAGALEVTFFAGLIFFF